MTNRTIRVPPDVHEMLAAQKQPGESFGDLLRRRMRPPANTCGELLARLEELPLPQVDDERMASFLTGRGRRSQRPTRRP